MKHISTAAAIAIILAATAAFTLWMYETPDSPPVQIGGSEARALYADDLRTEIIDVRDPAEYETKHIAGAISLPLPAIERDAPTAIPDKQAPLIVYCDSGQLSAIAADTLAAMGYTRIRDLGAMANWGDQPDPKRKTPDCGCTTKQHTCFLLPLPPTP